jgi:hypothetical protein
VAKVDYLYGVTVNVVVWAVLAKVAVSFTGVDEVTLKWLILNVTDLLPAGILTVVGTLAADA